MELQKQLTSLPLSQRLKELGVPQNAYFSHYMNAGEYSGAIVDSNMYEDVSADFKEAKLISAYSVAELLDMAPASTSLLKRTDLETKKLPRYYVETFEHYRDSDWNENPAEALGLMIEHLLTHGLITL